jgi:hypothetical protein
LSSSPKGMIPFSITETLPLAILSRDRFHETGRSASWQNG